MTIRNALEVRARELGFDLCRVTHAGKPASAPSFLAALAEGRHAEMSWLERSKDRRVDLQQVLPDVRSVVVLGISYTPGGPDFETVPGPANDLESSPARGEVARYARYSDYHEVLKRPLAELADWLDGHGGVGTRSMAYVDTGPILERDLAQRAGVGFIGKHTGLISRHHGNWLLLAEILTTVEIEPDAPEPNRCGHCTRCLSACPTRALPAPFTLDARRCIAYLTIELKGSIPVEFRPLIGNRIFGCDDCLAACPWNRFAQAGSLLRGFYRPDLTQPRLQDWLKLDAPGFRRLFRGTPLERTKRRGLLRNVCVALGNVGHREDLPALEKATLDPEPLIAEHAHWAMSAIVDRTGLSNEPPMGRDERTPTWTSHGYTGASGTP